MRNSGLYAPLRLRIQGLLVVEKPTSHRGATMKPVIAFLTFLLLLSTIAAEEDCEPSGDAPPAATSTPRPTPTPTVSVSDIEAMVVGNMLEQQQVVDAAISQDGKEISLVLIVSYATNAIYAAQLAENFVRLTKSLLKDGGVGKEIGTGEYDYVIGVYYPNEELFGMGAKARTADRISW